MNELALLEQQLLIERQKNELLEMKFEMQKHQMKKASRLDDSLFSPDLYEHYQKIADMLSESSIIPTGYRGKPEDVFIAMAMGFQLGFPVEQSLQDIAVINGRACLWGDGLISLALNHPECESIEEVPLESGGEVVGYTCTVIRNGHKPHSITFTLQDARNAGLMNRSPVWKAYPARMLQMRARSLAIRDKFADALRGLRIAEVENDDANERSSLNAEFSRVEHAAVPETQTDKLKAILNIRSNDDDAKQNEINDDGMEVSEDSKNADERKGHVQVAQHGTETTESARTRFERPVLHKRFN